MKAAGFGVAMGFILSRIGFSSWDEVHAMFVFADLRLFLSFGTAVVLLGLAWLVFARRVTFSPRPIHKGTILGSLLFGAGWALCGACPAIAWVQLGEGQLGALATLAGIVAGNWLYAAVHARYLRWDVGSCLDE